MTLAKALYFSLRRTLDLSLYDDIREQFHPARFQEQLISTGDKSIDERAKLIKNLYDNKVITDKDLTSYSKFFNEIRDAIQQQDNKYTAMSHSVMRVLSSEFKGEYIPKEGVPSFQSHVDVWDGKSKLLEATFDQGGNSFTFHDDLGYDDATFVDTPAVIQFHSLMDTSTTSYDEDSNKSQPGIPFHLRDLTNKLKQAAYTADLFESYRHISQKLNATYNGKLGYDQQSNEFILTRDGYKISSRNIASGIKSLGIFDMLVNAGHASRNTLLILDEPEVNLHPKWQIEYARAVCELVKLGSNIIVTTHSPYMLEALKGFSSKQTIVNHFYLTDKNNGQSTFIDVTNDLTPAIEVLSAPLYQLNEELDDDF
jgi:hypothetical protein